MENLPTMSATSTLRSPDGRISFGQRFRQIRLNAGMSQSGLARRSGVPKTMLSRYENDHILPSIQTLQRIAPALGVSEVVFLQDKPRDVGDEFLETLRARGVQLESGEQAQRLGHLIADLVDAREDSVGFLRSKRARRKL